MLAGLLTTLVLHSEEAEAHAYDAAHHQLPSHVFDLSPRWPTAPQLSFHLGLLQPLLLRGFNAAVDLRVGPLLLSYSHGQGLDYNATPGALAERERAAGLRLRSPWTTGGGVGVVLLDELWVMVDLKVHRYRASVASETVRYRTISLGGEVGWRYFVWRGGFVQMVLRYWPNVATSLPGGAVHLGGWRHEAKDLGFFANLMLGWSFEV